MIGIYSITCMPTEKRYIGQSVHIGIRKHEHLRELRKNNHFNKALQNAFNLYGEDNFTFEILEECSKDLLSEREIFWMNSFGGYLSKNLYNSVEGGRCTAGDKNPNYGKHWSEDWKRLQSDKMKKYLADKTNHPMYNKHHTDESKEKNRQSHIGMKHSEESKHKCSETMRSLNLVGERAGFYGRHHTDETKEKLRKSSSNYRHSLESRAKISKAVSGSKNGMYGKTVDPVVRKRLSENHKGSHNYMYNKKRITNGVINSQIDADKPLPEGFWYGMRPRSKKHGEVQRVANLAKPEGTS